MTRRAWGNTADLLLLSLRERGPSTSIQLAEELGLHRDQVASIITRLRRPGKRGPHAGKKRAHIAAWHRSEVAGARAYTRAIYAFGPGACAPKPPPKRPPAGKKKTTDG